MLSSYREVGKADTKRLESEGDRKMTDYIQRTTLVSVRSLKRKLAIQKDKKLKYEQLVKLYTRNLSTVNSNIHFYENLLSQPIIQKQP